MRNLTPTELEHVGRKIYSCCTQVLSGRVELLVIAVHHVEQTSERGDTENRRLRHATYFRVGQRERVGPVTGGVTRSGGGWRSCAIGRMRGCAGASYRNRVTET